MRHFKTSGLVLRRGNFGEADKIITIFTPNLGKIKAVARGVRRLKSRRAPHLELFNLVELVLHHGQTFDTITEAKIINDFAEAKKDLKLTGYLFYLAEVLDKILPEHQPHPEVFTAAQTTLAAPLSDAAVKKFVVQLLWDLGYLPKGEYPKLGATDFVESVVEKRIRSKKFLEEI
ncbi:DNA repair protein RecO [Candidatus Microgenomates bacterium]|nr:DNA repair protein RecO [Candidatus Microgenomates bacterium]